MIAFDRHFAKMASRVRHRTAGEIDPEEFVRKSVLRCFYHRLITLHRNPIFFQPSPIFSVPEGVTRFW